MTGLKTKNDKSRFVLQRTATCFSLLNIFPYNNGHVMVAPYAHAATLDALDRETQADLLALVSESQRILKKAFKPEGFNIGMNLGKAAGAGIDDHLHIHVVPRWGGDTNFMSVIGNVRVIPEDVTGTCSQLRSFFEQLQREVCG